MYRAKQLFYVLILVAVLSCVDSRLAPPSPTVRPFGNNAEWIVVEDMRYTLGTTSVKIVVPKGFVTDFASIPQVLWSFGLTPHGQYSRAAVVHDYLYWSQGCNRDQADRLLVIAMKESNVGWFDEWAVYSGVSGFGSSAWNANAKERSDGLPRVIPDKYLCPADPNMSWREYRDFLYREGVRDPDFDPNPEYCEYGDSTGCLRAQYLLHRSEAMPNLPSSGTPRAAHVKR
jgi:hypothetical protein